MKDKKLKSTEENRIVADAAKWIIKSDRGFTASEQDAFFQWLAEDPRHGEWIARHGQTWKEFNMLVEWRPEHSEEPNPDLLVFHKPKWNWNPWSGGALIAIAASVAIFLVLWSFRIETDTPPEGIQTTNFVSIDYEYQILEDGSELDMNEGAEVLVEYTKERRTVRLLSGEVHFTVAKNPNRPFVVLVGDTEVRAIGTAFNVRLEPESLEILVTEGQVRLFRIPVSRLDGTGSLESSPMVRDLFSGQKSVIAFDLDALPFSMIETVDIYEIEHLLAWKHELLDFNSTPLVDAIVEFNRRNEVQLVIADDELGGLPIVASFRSNNIDGFVRLLEFTSGIDADRSSVGAIVLRKK